MGQRTHREWCDLLAGERLPAAIVDLDAFDRNVTRVAGAARAAGVPVRLATKSIRVPALIDRVLASGEPFQGLMCFAAREAELLAARGCDDLLVAYPTAAPDELAVLRRMHEAGTRTALVVDCLEGARIVADAMVGVSTPFRLVLDIDMSLRLAGGRLHLGVRRSPIHDAASAAAVAESIELLLGPTGTVRVVGAMGYDAQVAGLGDRNPFRRLRNPAARLVRGMSMRRVPQLRGDVRRALERAGVEVEIFNGGGSGSLAHALADDALTEVTVGSALPCSLLFDYYRGSTFEPATWFALQATRAPGHGIITCQGGGYIASGEAGPDRLPQPVSPTGSRLVASEGAGEVQTPVLLGPGTSVELGEPVVFRHAKAGELAERFTEYLLVQGSEVVDRVPTYRGCGASYG